MNIQKFTDGTKTVHAALITETRPCDLMDGARTIYMQGIDSVANLEPSFVAKYDPQAGQFFVIDEHANGASIMDVMAFMRAFKPVKEN